MLRIIPQPDVVPFVKPNVPIVTSVTEIDSPPSPNNEQESNDDKTNNDESSSPLTETHLLASPYTSPANLLDLRPLDIQSRLLAHSLTNLSPLTTSYATTAYETAFNWPAVFAALRALCARCGVRWSRATFYVVVFRSRLRPSADRARLGELDRKSHEEACASGGLLKYWFGRCEDDGEEGRNLATCIWRNRSDAAAGGRGAWHRRARGAAREMYAEIEFGTYRLVVEDGAEEWRLEDYRDEEEGFRS